MEHAAVTHGKPSVGRSAILAPVLCASRPGRTALTDTGDYCFLQRTVQSYLHLPLHDQQYALRNGLHLRCWPPAGDGLQRTAQEVEFLLTSGAV
jgi:hypothetical protein